MASGRTRECGGDDGWANRECKSVCGNRLRKRGGGHLANTSIYGNEPRGKKRRIEGTVDEKEGLVRDLGAIKEVDRRVSTKELV